jgi:hypothetical protein
MYKDLVAIARAFSMHMDVSNIPHLVLNERPKPSASVRPFSS